MRKRQVKKFAKRMAATRNLTAYREARNGGSKRLARRARAFRRHAGPPSPELVAIRKELEKVRDFVRRMRSEVAQP